LILQPVLRSTQIDLPIWLSLSFIINDCEIDPRAMNMAVTITTTPRLLMGIFKAWRRQ